MQHTLYIVGAGPGDPDLLTLKASRALAQADAVVYDRLISSEILALIPPGAARFYAGKSCKEHVMTQDEINALLVALAKAGRKVVRLKGGDPFIFGRGSEEAEHLALHGVPFEVVPGITSVSGCAAAAGIPLTHRGLADKVFTLTGHSQNPEEELNWPQLADKAATLVVYMGLANLPLIARRLVEHGLPAGWPAAAIESATTPRERIVTGTLCNIVQRVKEADLQPPTLLIIGRVVELHKKIRKPDILPSARFSAQKA